MNNQSIKLVLPWLLVVLLASALVFISIQPKPEVTILPPDNRIDSLHHIVDSLDARVLKLRHEYDSVQANIKTRIKYIKEKNAQDISNIHNYNLDQRDSL